MERAGHAVWVLYDLPFIRHIRKGYHDFLSTAGAWMPGWRELLGQENPGLLGLRPGAMVNTGIPMFWMCNKVPLCTGYPDRIHANNAE